MSSPFLAEIRMFTCNFAPYQWAFCAGQLLPISQYTALFSLVGTYYGGNGTSNFALPNLQGTVPVCAGNGLGLSPYVIGETGGSTTITLTSQNIPIHNHTLNADPQPEFGNNASPAGLLYSGGQWKGTGGPGNVPLYTAKTAPNTQLAPDTLGNAYGTSGGGAQPHQNMMPYLAINFCIALAGIFPPRG